jgi:hypothetical protein
MRSRPKRGRWRRSPNWRRSIIMRTAPAGPARPPGISGRASVKGACKPRPCSRRAAIGQTPFPDQIFGTIRRLITWAAAGGVPPREFPHEDTHGDVARNGVRCGKLICGFRSIERLLEFRHVRLKLQRLCRNALQECAGSSAAQIGQCWFGQQRHHRQRTKCAGNGQRIRRYRISRLFEQHQPRQHGGGIGDQSAALLNLSRSLSCEPGSFGRARFIFAIEARVTKNWCPSRTVSRLNRAVKSGSFALCLFATLNAIRGANTAYGAVILPEHFF